MTTIGPTTEPPAAADEATAGNPAPTVTREAPGRVWGRRAAILVVLLGATALLVWGSKRAVTDLPTTTSNPAIVAQFPLPGGQAPSQTAIGAELAEGYDGRLTINGVAIPEKDMEGVLVPGSPEAASYTGKELRPNNRNHVEFRPGPGKAVEELRQGRNTITLRYFKQGRPETSRTTTWYVDVT